MSIAWFIGGVVVTLMLIVGLLILIYVNLETETEHYERTKIPKAS